MTVGQNTAVENPKNQLRDGGDVKMTAERTLTDKQFERRFWEAIYWGGVLVWAGLVFLVDSLGNLPQVDEADVWT